MKNMPPEFVDCPDDVGREEWGEWMIARKNKGVKGGVTALYLRKVRAQAEKVGLTLHEAIDFAAFKGWRGFEAAWYMQCISQEKRATLSFDALAKVKAEAAGVRANPGETTRQLMSRAAAEEERQKNFEAGRKFFESRRVH